MRKNQHPKNLGVNEYSSIYHSIVHWHDKNGDVYPEYCFAGPWHVVLKKQVLKSCFGAFELEMIFQDKVLKHINTINS